MSDKKNRLTNLMNGRIGTPPRNTAKEMLLADSESENQDNVSTLKRNNVKPETQTDVDTPIRNNVKPESQDDVNTSIRNNVKTETQNDVDTSIRSNVKPESQDDVDTSIRSNVKPETQTDVDTSIRYIGKTEKLSLKKSTLLLPHKDHFALKMNALQRGMSMSDVIQEIIHDYLIEQGALENE